MPAHAECRWCCLLVLYREEATQDLPAQATELGEHSSHECSALKQALGGWLSNAEVGFLEEQCLELPCFPAFLGAGSAVGSSRAMLAAQRPVGLLCTSSLGRRRGAGGLCFVGPCPVGAGRLAQSGSW